MALKSFALTLLLTALTATSYIKAQTQEGTSSGAIPGGQTAAGIMASSLDGMSRYFASNGPIQPAITAIAGAPLRGAEYLNSGINSLSTSLNRGAQSMSRRAGNEGNFAMPGMQSLRNMMPQQASGLGNMMRSAIRGKNSFIMGQAESGVEAANRMGNNMKTRLTRRKRDTAASSSSSSSDLTNEATMMHGGSMQMMDHMSNTMQKGGQQIKNQLQEHLNGAMSGMQGLSGVGDNLRNSAQGIGRTLTNGLQGTMEHLQRTGQQLQQQLQGLGKQGLSSLSNMQNSMSGNLGMMSKHMENNGQGLMKAAQGAVQQVQSSIHQAVQGPMSMLQNMQNMVSGMMSNKMNAMSSGKGGSSGGRY